MIVHTRDCQNGSRADIDLPKNLSLKDLNYKQKLEIRVNGIERKAVVDLIAPAFWGGPVRAFEIYDQSRQIRHVNIKLVWQDSNGNWQESRDVRPATEEEFLAWRKEFVGDKPPTPMP